MALVIGTFIALFVLVVSAGILLFYRDAMRKRLGSVLASQSAGLPAESTLWGVRGAGASIGALVGSLEKAVPKSEQEVSVIKQRLIRAGYRKDGHVRVFYGAKLAVPLLLCGLAFVTDAYEWGGLMAYALAAGLGFLAPDFWLGNRISARQLDIRFGLPEVLDFMVICIEAGLSLDQAVVRTTDELKIGQPVLCDELALVILEQRAGKGRADTWKSFADRTDVDVVRALTALIIQVDQFGTSIAKALRQHSDTLRTQRRQEAEEQAAKTAVKLVFPLVFFIFPSIFVVVLGPSMIVMYESFEKYLL